MAECWSSNDQHSHYSEAQPSKYKFYMKDCMLQFEKAFPRTKGQPPPPPSFDMARGRGGSKANAGSNNNSNNNNNSSRGKRATPYEGARQNRRGGGRSGENEGGGRRTRGGKGGGRGGGRGEKPKPRTAEDLDREMDSYWGKSQEHASKKLDGDMDDYWKSKGEEGERRVGGRSTVDYWTGMRHSSVCICLCVMGITAEKTAEAPAEEDKKVETPAKPDVAAEDEDKKE